MVLFAGIADGQPTFIGANNVTADGTVFGGPQQITEVPYPALMKWMSGKGFTPTITSAFHWQG